MRNIAMAMVLFSSLNVFAQGGYQCSGDQVFVALSSNEKNLTVTMSGETKTYTVVTSSSRTGDVDRTFTTNEGISLTIDDQYGDILSVNGNELPLKCRSL